MGRGTGFIGLIVVVAVGGYFYRSQLEKVVPGASATGTAINITGVKNDLLSMANAERRYLATHPRYASIEELREDGDIHVPSRPDYIYSIDANDSHFTITASYTGPDPRAPKRISVDEAMSLRTN